MAKFPTSINDNDINILAGVFDDHCFKKGNSINDDEHCEAIIFPDSFNNNCWILFVELKYDKQLSGVPDKAFNQVLNTIRQLRNQNTIDNNKLVYGVIYFPIASSKPPYTVFYFPPKILKDLRKQENIILQSSSIISVIDEVKLRLK